MPVVGSRFLIEAGFIIAVAVIAGVERLSTWWIIAVVASAWVIVAIVEIVVWTRQVVVDEPHTVEPSEPLAEAPAFDPTPPVRVRAQPLVEAHPEPEREPEPAPSLEPPRIVAVAPPPLEPEPEPETRPEPQPEPARVVAFIPASEGPREWNLWELERAARDHATDDVVRNEERSYLLMYLREFAGPDGILPTDFDGLVRDAFGDVLHTVGA